MAIKKVTMTEDEVSQFISGNLISENWSAYQQDLYDLADKYVTDSKFQNNVDAIVKKFKKVTGIKLASLKYVETNLTANGTYRVHGIQFNVGTFKNNQKKNEAKKAYAVYVIDRVFSTYNEYIDKASETYQQMQGEDYATKSRKMDPATKLNRTAGPAEFYKSVEETLPRLIRASNPENYRKNTLTSSELKSLAGRGKSLDDFGGNRMMLFYNHLLNAFDTLEDPKYYNTFYEILKNSSNLDRLYEDIIKPNITQTISELLFKYKNEIDSTFGSEDDYAKLNEMFNKLMDATDIKSADYEWTGSIDLTRKQPKQSHAQKKVYTTEEDETSDLIEIKVQPKKNKTTKAKGRKKSQPTTTATQPSNWRERIKANTEYYQSILSVRNSLR